MLVTFLNIYLDTNNTHQNDILGSGYNPIKSKSIGLNDYLFSIVVENCKEDYYFTEKLIDCLITGTIPIYWGCPSIDSFFNNDGIIRFETVEDLFLILSNINDCFYYQRVEIIKENFEIAKKYLVADNILYEKIKQS